MQSNALCTSSNINLNHIGFLAHSFCRSRLLTTPFSFDCRSVLSTSSYSDRKVNGDDSVMSTTHVISVVFG